MKHLIDADSVIYKAGCANEERMYVVQDIESKIIIADFKKKKDADSFCDSEEFEVVPHKEAGDVSYSLGNAKQIMNSITEGVPEFQVYIQGQNNFRYDLYPDYKGHRDPFGKPIHEQEIRDYLIKHWDAIIVDDEETDDRVSYLQCADPENTCISSIDKDLDNTAGWHYNFDKKDLYFIEPEQADLNFAKQLLTGDSTDNIKGLPRVGPAAANKILPHYTPDWLEIVQKEYHDRGFDDEYLILQGRLLWMRRAPEEMWDLDYEYV